MVILNGYLMEYMAMQIDITGDCNLNCMFCTSAVHKNKSKSLCLEDIKIILDKCKKINVEHIIISGGEPTLHPNLHDIIKMCKNYGFYVSLTSNGTLITDKNIVYLKDNVDNIQISVDSTHPNVHDNIRGVRGVFDRVLQCLEIIRKNSIYFSIRATFLPKTLSEMEEMVVFAIAQGAASISLNPVISSETTDKVNILSQDEMKYFFDTLEFLHNKYSDKIRISSANPIKNSRQCFGEINEQTMESECYVAGCTAGICNLYVNSNRELWPCPHLPINICTIDEDWEKCFSKSNVMLNLFKRNTKGKCGKCKYKRACGGCRGAAYGATGDYLAEIENCYVAEEV